MSGLGETSYTLADIAAQLGGDVLGDGQTRISQVATLASAGEGDIAFLANRKYRNQLQSTGASAVILAPDAAEGFAGPRIVTANPYAYYARVAALLNPSAVEIAGIHPTAVIESTVPASVFIGPHVCIGKNVSIGEGCRIHAGCVIGDGAVVGEGSVLYPNVNVYHGCRIGKQAILHSGVVIGADGFGFAPDGKEWVKIPQVGAVVIGDDVEIGANTTIDRGALDDTIIGDGCKIDNLVMIGHNCNIGPYSVIAGCTGMAGSTTLGEHCILGGASMISGHLSLAPNTTISGASTVMRSILEPGGVYASVFPLDSYEHWMRNASHIRRLSKLADRVSELEKQLKEKHIEG
ncbi:UDP-3-O-(3-hydroxymyristoyl)glucosamine N-acyltransferase [Dechloromonas sp. HYN0024]|uniref:UDP-3-O-(3-hydroxymyristoyl)glucosamine N-acyltransferase n=1 Tax=Dechloromonas sp. HYN0024 TaxID=2231055 RepID=UPI000E443B8F|nr:UDP-3-O-(3-hydroxymyristoyl)glucosamine N-acyltransferase [Dechloromonas sp. HYN0024]AXS80030.1 UDP-3-O-(3-hydroxymyristoyl)glucosamine N-acyltransferase [Dechloromonas sp. HYN0024]